MSTRKGFAAILIPLIVLVVLAVGGGVIIYSKNKTTSLKTTGQEIRQNPTKEDEQLPAQDVFKAQPNNFAAKTVVKENDFETKDYVNSQLKFTFKYPTDLQLEECPVDSILLYQDTVIHATPCTSKITPFLKMRVLNYTEKQLAQKYTDSFIKDHEWYFQQTATSTYATSMIVVMGHIAIRMDGVVSDRFGGNYGRLEMIGKRITLITFIHEGIMYELNFYDLPVAGYEDIMNLVLTTLKATAAGSFPTGKEAPLTDKALQKVSRDMQRIADLSTLKLAISLYISDVIKPSICEAGKTYRSTDGSRAINGTGWLPIDFTKISNGPPISGLFADPLNDTRYYYSYTCNPASHTFEVNAKMESPQYGRGGAKDVASTDKGNNPDFYEVGTDLNLIK